MNLNVQTKTATTSTTKLAVAFAFLGAAALAAAAASMPTAKLASDYGYGYQPPVLPIPNDQPDIRRFDMQIAPDKAVFITNSFSYQNMSLDQNSNGNTFTKTSDKVQATLQITPSVYQGTSPVSYGFGVVYNQFPVPKFNGEVNPFELEVLNKGVLTWSNKPRVSLTLDPVLSKTGYMTFFVLAKNEDGMHMVPEVAADDFTYIIMKNASTTPPVTPSPTSTPAGVTVSIENVYDATTVDKILTPSVTPVQVGKWKLVAQNGPVALNKITFQLADEKGKLVTDSTDFGAMTLYDAANMTEPIAMSAYQSGAGKGLVQFNMSKKVILQKDVPMYLVMKAPITGSGIMKPNSVRNWVMRVTTPSSISFVDMSGKELANKQIILATSTMTTAPGSSASYNYNLMHNAAPIITALDTGYSLQLGTHTPIFRFKVTNPGDRELRLNGLPIKVYAYGLEGNAATKTYGKINNWYLWEANEANGVLTNVLHTTTSCQIVGIVGVSGCAHNSKLGMPLVVNFEVNNSFAGANKMIIAPGASRTFALTADTTGIFTGKSSGVVTVRAVIDGDSGFDRTNSVWKTGPVKYYYTPVGSSKELGPFVQSDSYDVMGKTLTRTL